jgi:hypothetical protein
LFDGSDEIHPFLSGWMNRKQQAVTEYLSEEIRILRRIHGKKRRSLAAKAKKIRSGRLKKIANIAPPQTLLRWFRRFVAEKYDSSGRRRVGRPATREEFVELVLKMAKEKEVDCTREFEMRSTT